MAIDWGISHIDTPIYMYDTRTKLTTLSTQKRPTQPWKHATSQLTQPIFSGTYTRNHLIRIQVTYTLGLVRTVLVLDFNHPLSSQLGQSPQLPLKKSESLKNWKKPLKTNSKVKYFQYCKLENLLVMEVLTGQTSINGRIFQQTIDRRVPLLNNGSQCPTPIIQLDSRCHHAIRMYIAEISSLYSMAIFNDGPCPQNQ